ncbi:alpha/beta hydrolase [Ottowia thiooxydans]|uniref:Dienelactone hydrolase n=1 Tax=Ottowia thiooxydans TaxID=219182 RepID=A0ABV2QCX7_9BURK
MTSKVAYPALHLPTNVQCKKVSIFSNGVELDADLYVPLHVIGTQGKLPAVVMSHGLGGDKKTAERYAALFAQAGMIALSFSHSGWGDSGARPIVVETISEASKSNEALVKVVYQRHVVDPMDWLQNFRAATDFLEGEVNVDPSRMGAWGTSYGGGIAFHSVCNDARLKCLSLQVASLSGARGAMLTDARTRAIDVARGVTSGLLDPNRDRFPATPGIPHLAQMSRYRPLNELLKLSVPTLMIDAGSEELFDIREHCGFVAKHLQSNASIPHHYEVIPEIDHYGIYFEGFERSSTLARDWLAEHLGAAPCPQ